MPFLARNAKHLKKEYFRVVNDTQAASIISMFDKLHALVAPYNFTIANYPSLDDMYTAPSGN